MKDFLLFLLPDCPYCRKALFWQNKLLAEHPEYRGLPLRILDERQELGLAAELGYTYVPCYFWGREKLAEGVLTRGQIAEVFQRVWAEAQADSSRAGESSSGAKS